MEFEEMFLIQQEKTSSYLKVINSLEKFICEQRQFLVKNNSQISYVTLTGIIIKENSFNRLPNKETSINAT